MNRRLRSKFAGFTMMELLIVLLIIALLTVVITPNFSKMMKGSRVQQAAQSVVSSLYRARALAQKYRSTVGVFYGDDPSAHPAARWVPPLSTTLPKYGQIEIWSVRTAESWNWVYTDRGYGWSEDGVTATLATPYDPVANTGNGADWFPYYARDQLLTPQPISFPDGVRIMAGRIDTGGQTKLDFVFWSYLNDPVGEIKRHNSVYTKNGSCPTYDQYHCYLTLLIWDVTTGEHVIVEVGEHKSSSRPRILDKKLTHINGAPLTDYKAISSLVN
jgi:prepilin-type N-terminal cleavage/methylation domain-containing protein